MIDLVRRNKERGLRIRTAYEELPKKCKHCSADLSYEKRYNDFCGHSCAASHANRGVVRNGKKVDGFCKNCGSKLTRNESYFCSKSCCNKFKWEQRKERILEIGDLIELKGSPSIVRRFLFETRGKKCEICGLSEWMGQEIPLVADHADGNAENWHEANLRLVCGNCNMQLPTFAGRNIGKGRKDRRESYKPVKERRLSSAEEHLSRKEEVVSPNLTGGPTPP